LKNRAMSKRVEKEIEFYSDVLKILSAFAIAIGGGTAGLIFKLHAPLNIAMFFLGLWIESSLLISMARIYLKVKYLLEDLKNE